MLLPSLPTPRTTLHLAEPQDSVRWLIPGGPDQLWTLGVPVKRLSHAGKAAQGEEDQEGL